MSAIFQSIPSPRIPKNNFNLTHEILTSGRMGKLIPIQAQLCVPGDRFKQDVNFLMRFAPLAGAAMARLNVHFHSFFVPLRLLTPQTSRQSGWEDFLEKIGAQGTEIPQLPVMKLSADLPIPYAEEEGVPVESIERLAHREVEIGSLWDYLKLPCVTANTDVNMRVGQMPSRGLSIMKFYGYQLIYDQWYRRDQIEKPLLLPLNVGTLYLNSISESEIDVDEKEYTELGYSSEINAKIAAYHNLFTLRTRNYERDYFTASLPEPQIGEDVTLGTGKIAVDELLKITSDGGFLSADTGRVDTSVLAFKSTQTPSDVNYPLKVLNSTMALPQGYDQVFYDGGSGVGNIPPEQLLISGVDSLSFVNPTVEGLKVPVLSINEFRFAMQFQGVKEKVNRGGTRFKEIMNSIYNIDTSDARLQRVQYLGGCKNPVQIGTVIQTSSTTEESPLGTLAGRATSAGGTRLFKTTRPFEEHGFIFTIMSVTPRTSYFGGIPRDFMLHDPIDFYVPDFDRLGEDVVYTQELYSNILGDKQNLSDPDKVFGYEPKYSYLKSSTSSVTGEFRNTLRYLHLSRSFDDEPLLSPEFIHAESEDFDRIFNFENIEGTSNEHFYTEILITQKAKRPMSKYSIPLTLV